jgi:hypothetical protein
MSLRSSRGIVRTSRNLRCVLQAAMVVERVSEPEFYERVTGTKFEGEYGERASARRRGSKFESNLTTNNAALLRRALAPIFGYDVEAMVVRNFADEIPGPPHELHAMRLTRMRRILQDLARDREVPHLVIQPQLRIQVGPNLTDFEHVSPDFFVLNPAMRMYVPGEMKSFIVRQGVADGADLDLTRRQAAAQIVALRDEAGRLAMHGRVENRALFVFAQPYGLMPARPVIEVLNQEVFEVERAVQFLREVRARLVGLRASTATPLEDLIAELPINYQDRCIGSCVLATVCERRFAGRARVLGDAASDLIGPDTDVGRLVALINGAQPRTPEEAVFATRVRLAAAALGYQPRTLRRATG